eukprot:gene12553-17893_t
MSAHARVRDVRDNPHKIIGTLQEADWIAGYLDKVTGYLHAKEDNASGGNSPEMARTLRDCTAGLFCHFVLLEFFGESVSLKFAEFCKNCINPTIREIIERVKTDLPEPLGHNASTYDNANVIVSNILDRHQQSSDRQILEKARRRQRATSAAAAAVAAGGAAAAGGGARLRASASASTVVGAGVGAASTANAKQHDPNSSDEDPLTFEPPNGMVKPGKATRGKQKQQSTAPSSSTPSPAPAQKSATGKRKRPKPAQPAPKQTNKQTKLEQLRATFKKQEEKFDDFNIHYNARNNETLEVIAGKKLGIPNNTQCREVFYKLNYEYRAHMQCAERIKTLVDKGALTATEEKDLEILPRSTKFSAGTVIVVPKIRCEQGEGCGHLPPWYYNLNSASGSNPPKGFKVYRDDGQSKSIQDRTDARGMSAVSCDKCGFDVHLFCTDLPYWSEEVKADQFNVYPLDKGNEWKCVECSGKDKDNVDYFEEMKVHYKERIATAAAGVGVDAGTTSAGGVEDSSDDADNDDNANDGADGDGDKQDDVATAEQPRSTGGEAAARQAVAVATEQASTRQATGAATSIVAEQECFPEWCGIFAEREGDAPYYVHNDPKTAEKAIAKWHLPPGVQCKMYTKEAYTRLKKTHSKKEKRKSADGDGDDLEDAAPAVTVTVEQGMEVDGATTPTNAALQASSAASASPAKFVD